MCFFKTMELELSWNVSNHLTTKPSGGMGSK